MRAIGVTNASNFKRTIREHKAFLAELERVGVMEDGPGKRRTRFARDPWCKEAVSNAVAQAAVGLSPMHLHYPGQSEIQQRSHTTETCLNRSQSVNDLVSVQTVMVGLV